MQNIFSKRDFLNKLLSESVLVEKGKFDNLFLFVSDYLYNSHHSGIMLTDEEGIGRIMIYESKSIELFYAFYVASRVSYPIEITKIIIEAEYLNIITNNTLTEIEILELVLMKQLLIALYENEIEAIIDLASAFCSSETRHNVTLQLSKIKNN